MAPSQSPDAAMATLVATGRTNRCHNPFFRQQQLKFLHDTLRASTTELRNALKQDTGVTDAEATTEVACVLSLVRDYCTSIDPKKEIEEEYRVAKGKDAVDTKVPWGVAYIEADLGHSPLFSVLSPVAAAVAAGCCVGVKIDNNLNTLPSLLRTLLTKALEQDTFQVLTSTPSSSALSPDCVSVLQSTPSPLPSYSQLASPQGRVIAIVDRTANLASAAQNLVNARFAFGGTSPYAPDLILVNEFAKREFLEEILKCSLPYIAGASATSRTKSSRFTTDLQTLKDSSQWNVSVVTQSDSGAIVELSTPTTDLAPLPGKVSTPLLCISAITSLDHAIDLISSDSEDALVASYHFAAPAHTKYLSQFVKSNLTFANHIPGSLLLGPAAPTFRTPEIETRYTKAQFLRDAPVFVQPSTSASSSSGVKVAVSSKQADKQLAVAAKEIKLKKRAEWIAIGFFEQGILIGLGLYGIPLVTCLGATVFFGVRAVMRKVAAS